MVERNESVLWLSKAKKLESYMNYLDRLSVVTRNFYQQLDKCDLCDLRHLKRVIGRGHASVILLRSYYSELYL